MLALSMVSLELCLQEVIQHLSLSMVYSFQYQRSKAVTTSTAIASVITAFAITALTIITPSPSQFTTQPHNYKQSSTSPTPALHYSASSQFFPCSFSLAAPLKHCSPLIVLPGFFHELEGFVLGWCIGYGIVLPEWL